MGFITSLSGALTELKHCPGATVNLMLTIAITKTGARIIIYFDKKSETEILEIYA